SCPTRRSFDLTSFRLLLKICILQWTLIIIWKMPEKNLIHVWKETLSSKPVTRETLNGMHLTALHQATQQKLDEYLLYIRFEIHDFILCELKGRPKELTGFELPQKEEEILWLCIQLHGRLS